MTLEELRKAEREAYSRWMYYEAAERGHDHRAARGASDDYIVAKGKREQAEVAASRNLLAALQSILPYAESELDSLRESHRRDGGWALQDAVSACEAVLAKAQEAIDFMAGGAA